MTETTISSPAGSCRCGRYRFRASKDPFMISYCHCNDCRKSTGAPVTVFVGFRENEIQLLGDDAAVHESAPTVQRLFCAACGTPIGYRDSRLTGEIYYYLGVMENPSGFSPQLHAWTTEQIEWFELADDLPRLEGFSRPR